MNRQLSQRLSLDLIQRKENLPSGKPKARKQATKSGAYSEREPLKSVSTNENLAKKSRQSEQQLAINAIKSTESLDNPGSVKHGCWAQWTL